MGPFRRRLIGAAAFCLAPQLALAGVCEATRPYWNPEDGDATGMSEIIDLFTSVPGLGILGAILLGILTKTRVYSAIAALFAGIMGIAFWVLESDPNGVTQQAMDEGCIGPQGPVIITCMIITFMSVAAIIRLTMHPPQTPPAQK